MTLLRHGLRLLAEMVGAGAMLAIAIVWPPGGEPVSADAVVLLSGDGSRLPVAMRLMDQRISSTLVFAGQPDIQAVIDLCQTGATFEVICLRPSPDTTRTEAQAVGALARDRGWQRIVVVTSKFHMARAGIHFRRCFPGSVDTYGEYPPYGLEFVRRQVAHEWLGLVHASLLSRGC